MFRVPCVHASNRIGFSKSSITRLCAVIFLTLGAGLIPAPAQSNRHLAPGKVMIPDSNHVDVRDVGIKAGTNLRLLVAPVASPSEAPPFAGYGYETPASLACIYQVVAPITGCNPNSTVNTPNGGSQSIAIVDAYDDPNAASDLEVYSAQFGLPFDPSKFRVVYASGTQPPADPTGGWEIEESLDIEISHAMAPRATLYLVEAASNYYSDLFPAVQVAANLVRCGRTGGCDDDAHGRGEVSMSWGGGEFSGETAYDSYFLSHGVVFLAAAGDGAGVIYPSASPYVVAVGGSSTARSVFSGDLIQEIVWSDAGSGWSSFEPTPAYQSIIAGLALGSRVTPDISADANPNTGVWFYDSLPTFGGWGIVGGTSLSTPLTAGILNAASTVNHHFANSSADELTKWYGEYTNAAAYAADFNDITYGACYFYSGNFAGPGFDLCSGLGSPKGLTGK